MREVPSSGSVTTPERMSPPRRRLLSPSCAHTRQPAHHRLERLLRDQGARVSFHDPHAQTLKIDGGESQHSRPLTAANLKRADLVIIVTDHTDFDYDMIARHATLILDTRNATRGVKSGRPKIHKL